MRGSEAFNMSLLTIYSCAQFPLVKVTYHATYPVCDIPLLDIHSFTSYYSVRHYNIIYE
jgi:hypothetical protein